MNERREPFTISTIRIMPCINQTWYVNRHNGIIFGAIRTTKQALPCQLNHNQGRFTRSSRSFGNFGDPNPETGSQPLLALKPCVSQPGLLPTVIYKSKPR